MQFFFAVGCGAVDFDFYEFADADVFDLRQAVVVDGVTDGHSLRIEDAAFGHDNDLCFHAGEDGRARWKVQAICKPRRDF